MERFPWKELPEEELNRLNELSRLCKGDILTMTTLAGSGHPGGSMSSLDIYLAVYSYARIAPSLVDDPTRDRIVVSHGHTSPGVYSVLGRLGFFPLDAAVATFRQAGSIFDGHVVRKVPGVEWGTGNLGQGLSAGCGFALSARIHNRDSYTVVLMSDGEQTKGQVGEARRFAV
ncbi:MAG TPA: transketolase, partial [bacterium]|nr:transketolase [bacterium]